MKSLSIPKLTPDQYETLIEALFDCGLEKDNDKSRLGLIRKLEKETQPYDGEAPKKDIKQKLIEKIMENHEGDQILIDILHLDLHEIAERELNLLDEERLLDILLEH